MSRPLAAYIRRHPPDPRWPLRGISSDIAVEMIVVIPSLAEYDCLFHSLEKLARSAETVRSRVLVICVVNNRCSYACTPADRENNARTLERLQEATSTDVYSPLCLGWVDASSPGSELPDHEGVGLARRIGLDHGLRIFCRRDTPCCPLISLDADTLVDPDYLEHMHAFYASGSRWGGYAGYAHPLDPREPQFAAMVAYECYLRYHELGLRWAGSPYAYPALGSVISCTATAYAASGGMNRRLAGEDFYFLQQLVKTGRLEPIPGVCVHPSSRRSLRVPFGTGRTVDRLSGNISPLEDLYHPQIYAILKQWLSVIKQHTDASSTILLQQAERLSPTLRTCLEKRGFDTAWERIRKQHRHPAGRLHQFDVWFDGLRTIQFIHRLQQSEYPNLPLEVCLQTLFQWLGQPLAAQDAEQPSGSAHRNLILLGHLRKLCGQVGA